MTVEETKELQRALDKVTTLGENFVERIGDIDELKRATKANQEVIDQAAIFIKETRKNGGAFNIGKKTFAESFAEVAETKAAELAELEKDKKGYVKMEVKAATTVTLSNLTGDPVATYGSSPILQPQAKVNFRDLIATTPAGTGTYVQYSVTDKEGGVAQQTEGQEKSKYDFNLAEVKTVQNYVAGTTTFSKQLLKNLPWLQNTLPRVLMRKFFEAENSKFMTAFASGATASITSSETDDVLQLIDFINKHMKNNYNASFALVDFIQMARLQKLLYGSGNAYQGQGGVVSLPNGSITISGTPILPVSWITDDKVAIIDQDYIERVEAESLNITFSYEHDQNFTKNLVTARIEAMEELNIMLGAAQFYGDFGNAS